MKQTALKVLSAAVLFGCLAYIAYAGTYLTRMGLREVTRLLESRPQPVPREQSEELAEAEAESREQGKESPLEGLESTDQLARTEAPRTPPLEPQPQREGPKEKESDSLPAPEPKPTQVQRDHPVRQPVERTPEPAQPMTSIADAGPTYDQMRTALDRAQKMR